MKFINLYNQDKKLLNLFIKDLKKLIKKSDFILGSKVTEFENNFAKFCNAKYSIYLILVMHSSR